MIFSIRQKYGIQHLQLELKQYDSLQDSKAPPRVFAVSSNMNGLYVEPLKNLSLTFSLDSTPERGKRKPTKRSISRSHIN